MNYTKPLIFDHVSPTSSTIDGASIASPQTLAETPRDGMARIKGKPVVKSPDTGDVSKAEDLECAKRLMFIVGSDDPSKITQSQAIAYLLSFARRYLVQFKPGPWKSFGVKISNENTESITPLNLVRVERGTSKHWGNIVDEVPEQRMAALALVFLTIHRLSKYKERKEAATYMGELGEKLRRTLGGDVFGQEEVINANAASILNIKWTLTSNFTTLVAAFDMFAK
jgi:hypothetical protein